MENKSKRGGARIGAGRPAKAGASRHEIFITLDRWESLSASGNASKRIEELIDKDIQSQSQSAPAFDIGWEIGRIREYIENCRKTPLPYHLIDQIDRDLESIERKIQELSK